MLGNNAVWGLSVGLVSHLSERKPVIIGLMQLRLSRGVNYENNVFLLQEFKLKISLFFLCRFAARVKAEMIGVGN